MQRITLRDILFTDDASKYKNSINLSSDCARALLRSEIAEWCLQHDVELKTASDYDYSTQFLHFRIYARVKDSLATYYLLRWGQPEREQIHT